MPTIQVWQCPSLRRRQRKLQRLVELTRPLWDHTGVRPCVGATLNKMLLCGTPALGANVFSSIAGETITVYYTCKTRACPSCGFFQSLRFEHEVVNQLPDILYRGLILTIPHRDPGRYWEILRLNRQLLPDLVALGGGVMSDLARERRQAEVPLIAVLHTFNPELKFKPHVHVVVGLTGLGLNGDRLVENIFFSKDMLQERWRHALLDRLELDVRQGRLRSNLSQKKLLENIDCERGRPWHIEEHGCKNKHQLLAYVARYIGRPPIANSRILELDAHHVRFRYRDKLDDNRVHEDNIPTQEFLDRLIEHIREPYQHGVRYFGLLSPRAKSTRYPAFLRLLGRPELGPVHRLRWREARYLSFGVDPLVDSWGNPMIWSHRLPPSSPQPHPEPGTARPDSALNHAENPSQREAGVRLDRASAAIGNLTEASVRTAHRTHFDQLSTKIAAVDDRFRPLRTHLHEADRRVHPQIP